VPLFGGHQPAHFEAAIQNLFTGKGTPVIKRRESFSKITLGGKPVCMDLG